MEKPVKPAQSVAVSNKATLKNLSFQKPPLNLFYRFSISSFGVILLLTFGLGWFLGEQVKEQLLQDSKVMITSIIQSESLKYLEDESLIESYQNTRFLHGITDTTMGLPEAFAFDVILPSGKTIWSNLPSRQGKKYNNRFFNLALRGISSLDFNANLLTQKEILPGFSFFSAAYIPIERYNRILGVIVLHRKTKKMRQEIASLQKNVYWLSFSFGTVIYFSLLLVVLPASRTIRQQYQRLQDTASSLKELNLELQQTQKQLVQNERFAAIGEVCGAVAHGLKNPIAGVRSAVQLINSCPLSEKEMQELTGDIILEVDRLTKRLNDLLNFVRPFHVNQQNISLVELLENSIRTLNWKAMDQQIQIQALPPDFQSTSLSSGLIQGDATLLEEALLIVLGNALDASSSNNSIDCQVQETSSSYQIVVQDHGKGIPTETFPKIFEQFFTTKTDGVGLGLALCKKIIDLHQGKILIESKVDQGTKVQFVFNKAFEVENQGVN